MAAPSRSAARGTQRVRLEPKDSFDLIRLLARSQSDARKAVGELVQNSLDAGARRVEILWFNERGRRMLSIRDDGEGIFPQLEREEALRRLAKTIGHSHKRSFSPLERHQQMVLGKYGIGLLGFWCVAREMEIRSRVGGGETWGLRLQEERREAEVLRLRTQRAFDEPTSTEILLRDVKEAVQRQVRPARLQAFLAGELRGQLLQREVRVLLRDKVARGRAQKLFVVEPRPYLGRPLDDLAVLPVEGHDEARLELYHVPADEQRRGVVSLACGGATVLDDIADVDPTDPQPGRDSVWRSGRFEGVVDFADLQVAPGTRRGFVPDEAALAFVLALQGLEQDLARRLEGEERARAEQRREQVAREIRRAFAPVARRLPEYDLFDVRDGAGSGRPAATDATDGAAASGAPLAEASADELSRAAGQPLPVPEPDAAVDELDEPDAPEPATLFPPGPLEAVRVQPARLRLAPAARRVLRARAVDADGRAVEEPVDFAWRLEGPGVLECQQGAAGALYLAPQGEADASILVEASSGERSARAQVAVSVREGAAAERGVGIPEPEPVDAPSEPWRSRMRAGRWEYNEGHPDHRAVAADPARRVRYLIHLFAKEVVVRNFGSSQDEALLERMVEVLTHLGDGRGR